jgi:Tol biopolymer transport system component
MNPPNPPDEGPRDPQESQRTEADSSSGPGRPPDNRPRRSQSPPGIPDHQLLRLIGRGAYGDVWLARNVMGTYRAVKIVYCDNFDSDRPYEREFSGIQSFEPISRSHDSQVDILHVGRNDAQRCFFYVMELADDETQGRQIQPDTYAPKTVRSALQRRSRFSLTESLEIGLALATALEHLHGKGLIHRDIKPANVIFVNGRPKLADIGLVTETDGTMSFVGTEGYLPPEGPGTVQADIYSLGKTLYEVATGKDRLQFPELPTVTASSADEAGLFELNDILLKACHPDILSRYPDAAGLRRDLELVRSGKSVRARRRTARWWATGKRAAIITCVVLMIAGGGYLLAPRLMKVTQLVPRKLAVEEPRGWLDISPDGRRIAFALPERISIWDRDTQTTRPIEIRGAEGWISPNVSGWNGPPRWAPDNRRLACLARKMIGGSTDGPVNAHGVFVIDTDTGEATKIGPDLSETERILDWCWRPDGQGLTCVTEGRRFHTLALTGERTAWRETDLAPSRAIGAGDYSPDGRWLVFWMDNDLPTRGERDLWLMPHLGGQAVRLTSTPGFEGAPTWGPDGESVYFVSEGGSPLSTTRGIWKLRIDPKNGTPNGPAREVFVKKGQQLGRPRFTAGGRDLTYLVTEPNTRIWVAAPEIPAPGTTVARGQGPVLAPDGQTIYFAGETPEQQGVFALDRQAKNPPRRLGDVVPIKGHFPRSFLQVSPDGGLLAVPGFDGNKYGLFLVPTGGGASRLIETIQRHEGISPVWSPDGQWLAYAVGKDLFRVSRDLKTREVLATLPAWDSWNVRWSADGKHIAALAYFRLEDSAPRGEMNHVVVVNVADKRLRRLTPDSEDKYKEGLEWHPDSRRLTYFYYGPEDFSAKLKWAYLDEPGRTEEMIDQDEHWDYIGVWAPDGRHFHFISFPDNSDHKDLHVYDAQTRQITHGLRDGSRPEWSHDGRTMVWAVTDTLRYFEVIENFPQ